LPTHSRASRGSPGGLGGKAHPEPPLSSLAFGNASRTFHDHTARVAGLARLTTGPPARGRTTTTLLMVRLCNLAEPTGSAQVSRAYPYMVSPGRGLFQQPASGETGTSPLFVPAVGVRDDPSTAKPCLIFSVQPQSSPECRVCYDSSGACH
jgi:hypothetical protein